MKRSAPWLGTGGLNEGKEMKKDTPLPTEETLASSFMSLFSFPSVQAARDGAAPLMSLD